MLKIKLARFGKRHQPIFRIVVNEARDKRDGSYVEKIGLYIPDRTPKVLEVDVDRYTYWISQGAQPTDTVAGLIERFKSGNPFPAKPSKPSKKAQAKAAEAAKAEAEAKAAPEPEKEKPVEAEVEAKADEANAETAKTE